MAKSGSFERQLAHLAALEEAPSEPEALSELRAALRGRNSLLAAKAAEIAGRCGLGDLIPDLVDCFHRYLIDPEKTDRQCLAKIAAVKALNRLEAVDAEVFLAGIRHRQMEPVWNKYVDTAPPLRGECAAGLARIGWPGVFLELTTLLMDPEPAARESAVKAAAFLGGEKAELILRMKVEVKDDRADILGECISSLISIHPERSIEFTARYLNSDNDEIAEAAALALGESKEEAALKALLDGWEDRMGRESREMLVLPIALHRSRRSFDFLLSLVEESSPRMAIKVIEALGSTLTIRSGFGKSRGRQAAAKSWISGKRFRRPSSMSRSNPYRKEIRE
jgi:HEAT repeat protein